MLRRLRRSGGDDARRSSAHAVDAGDRDAMYARGYQYSNETDPPDLDAARGWYERAANAGHVDAMYALGVLYAELMQPPNVDAARGWYERAASARTHRRRTTRLRPGDGAAGSGAPLA